MKRIRFNNKTASIDSYDAFKLASMAAAVLENRPSFQYLNGNVDGHTATIYTRFHPEGETLVLATESDSVTLCNNDKVWLSQIIEDTKPN